MSHPLNPGLYNALLDVYGQVKIDHEGEAFNRPSIINPVTGKPRLHKILAGEMYRINCPYCPDRRKRLYINHMFGKTLSDQRKGSFLLHCFNANCMSDPQNRYEFTQGLEWGRRPLARMAIGKGKSREKMPITMPGTCVPLHKLPYHHRANAYLGSRMIDGHRWSRLFGASYCTSVLNPLYSRAMHRIVIPIWDNGQLIGWQARYVGDVDWKREDVSKYYTCPNMSYSHTVLNLEKARQYYTGVLIEGWFDRFAVGPMGMPLMGHNLNDMQIGKLAVAFRRGSLVYLLDPDEFDTERHHKLIPLLKAAMPGRFAPVRLPGVDPDQLDCMDVLRPFIKQEAARQGVKVKFSKRKQLVVAGGDE